MARDFLRQLEYLEHRRALADNSVKLQVLKQFFFETANLAALREEFGELVEGALEPGEIDRLADVVVGAALDGVDRGIDRVVAGHQNHVHSRIELEGFLQKREPVHTRHLEISQNHAASA